jgi:hypothetical protein
LGVKYAIGGLAVLWGVVLGVSFAVFDAFTAWMVGAAMVIVTLLGAAPVAFQVVARRRQEARGRDEVIIRGDGDEEGSGGGRDGKAIL